MLALQLSHSSETCFQLQCSSISCMISFAPHCERQAYLLRLLSETMHSTSSSLQLVHGAPCSTTLHRTLRARQHWQAFEALRLTLFAGRAPAFNPASVALLLAELMGASEDAGGESAVEGLVCSLRVSIVISSTGSRDQSSMQRSSSHAMLI